MILVDTSVWIEHLNRKDATLSGHLLEQSVLIHPFVIGELSLGNLRDRAKVLALLSELPSASIASHDEMLRFIDNRRMHGMGIGYVDAHLLAATALTPGARLWTKDKRLLAVAVACGLAALS